MKRFDAIIIATRPAGLALAAWFSAPGKRVSHPRPSQVCRHLCTAQPSTTEVFYTLFTAKLKPKH